MTITHILVDFENTQPSADDVALLHGPEQRLWVVRGPSQKKYDAEFAEALLALGDRVRFIKCERSGRNALDMHIAFQIGRLLGELTQAPDAPAAVAFVVVSRDTDYEPLLQYIRAQGYAASRVVGVREALGAAPARAASAAKTGRSRNAALATAAKTRAPAAKTKPAKKAPAMKRTKAAARSAAATSAARTAAAASARAAAQSLDGLVDKVIDRLRDQPRNRPTRRDRMESWIASHLRSKLAEGDVPAIVAALEKRGVVTFNGNKVEYPFWA